MSTQQESAVQQTSEVQQINALRDGIRKTIFDHNLSFNVVFTALSQLAAQSVFEFCLLQDGDLTDENVADGIAKFVSQTEATSKVGLENMREIAKAEAEANTPKIIVPDGRIITKA